MGSLVRRSLALDFFIDNTFTSFIIFEISWSCECSCFVSRKYTGGLIRCAVQPSCGSCGFP